MNNFPNFPNSSIDKFFPAKSKLDKVRVDASKKALTIDFPLHKSSLAVLCLRNSRAISKNE